MRTGSCLSTALAISSLFAEAIAADNVKAVRIPFTKEKRVAEWDASPGASRLRRRQNIGKTALEKLDNKDYLFYANVSLGTPPQPLRLHIDTGSSDIWVESANSTLCNQVSQPCSASGVYDNNTSSTYKYISDDFSITYVDQEYATGDYGTDTFSIGGISVENLQFGYGLHATSEQGVMGIGFRDNEAQTAIAKAPYNNLPYLMQEQGYINSVAYSLWLNDLDALEGEILFGGIDTAKYEGNLTTLSIDKRSGDANATEFIITLTGISLTNAYNDNKTILDASTTGVAVLLDTGASFTYLPSDVASELANEIGAVISTSFGGPILPCSKKAIVGTINFIFSDITIRVPLDEFIIDATTSDGSTYVDPTTKEEICFFGILGVDNSDSSTLGDTFLRSAYVVYDLSNEEISLAQTVFNTTVTNILEIKAGAAGVPQAQGASSALTVVATATEAAGGLSTAATVVAGATTTLTGSETMTTSTMGTGTAASTHTSTGLAVPGSTVDTTSYLFGAIFWIAALFI